MKADLANFYLGPPLDRKEYAHIKIDVIPQEFINKYRLMNFVHNGWVYFEISNGMYGLKQDRKLGNDLLQEHLEAHGYYKRPTTPELWRHKCQPITFVLIVNNFGVEYMGQRHADHLIKSLQKSYPVTTDWEGKKFAAINITWGCTNEHAK